MAAIVPCEHGWAPGICVTCLQRQLQQAQEKERKWMREAVRRSARLLLIEEERDEARRHWQRCEEGWNKTIRTAEQAIKRAGAAEAMLGRFGQWLRAEIRRGTLNLGFDIGWSANAVLRELEQTYPAEAPAQRGEGDEPI